jgi:hypothetical protein
LAQELGGFFAQAYRRCGHLTKKKKKNIRFFSVLPKLTGDVGT